MFLISRRLERFDLKGILTRVVESVRLQAEKKGLTLRVDIAPEIGFCTSDSRRVEQIILNLLNNAIKFTDRGSVSLKAFIDGDRLNLSVSDTGIGIKPEDLALLFVPFKQVDTGLTRQHEGTGLGLAICRSLADLLGGEIHATSNVGEGSVFTVNLPDGGTPHEQN
jgi:signal transduction histidine kinase